MNYHLAETTVANACQYCGSFPLVNGRCRNPYCINGPDLPEPNPRPALSGWVCPRCGRIYSPFVDTCPVCGPTIVASNTSGE